jgi:hypothetical protein
MRPVLLIFGIPVIPMRARRVGEDRVPWTGATDDARRG